MNSEFDHDRASRTSAISLLTKRPPAPSGRFP